uniref:Uncharacterized protein n=1 Tax=Megaselia scalaris TaxID=36166 RepID=T1H016_MEGSC
MLDDKRYKNLIASALRFLVESCKATVQSNANSIMGKLFNDEDAKIDSDHPTFRSVHNFENPNIDSHWNTYTKEIRRAASEILCQKERTGLKEWRDEEYDKVVGT